MEYRIYRCSFKEMLLIILASLAASAIISYLFYDCFWGMVGTPILVFLVKRKYEATQLKKQKDTLILQFMDMLRTISAALLAGYSMENSWKEAQKEMAMLHGEKSYIYRELDEMNKSIAMNIPVEKLMLDFAERAGADEISSFAEIFAYAKRSGGNYVQIIDNTSYRICSKYETEREIEVSMAAKKLEQKIMNLIPLFILAYMKLTSAEYMSVLYGNILGVLFMTICIGVYIGAYYLAERIMDIHI